MTEPIDIAALEQRLAPLSHGAEALTVLRDALARVGKWRERQTFLNAHLLRAPIRYEAVKERLPNIDQFHVLQGDVVRTNAAYVLGNRRVGAPSYVVATSTCDLVPDRRLAALLLPLEPRRPTDFVDDGKLRNDLANLMALKSTRYLYLPPMPDDDSDVLFNIAHLDPYAQCSNAALALVNRRASMTLIGWRVLGALLRALQIREASDEAVIRRLEIRS